MENIKIVLIQPDIAWEKPEENLTKYTVLLENAEDADLYILPEMFTTGFSMAAEKVAEDEAEATLPWLISLAAEQGVAITGSLAVRDKGQVYNRLLFVTPDGEIESTINGTCFVCPVKTSTTRPAAIN